MRILLESALSDDTEVGDYETDLLRPGDPRRLILHVQNLVYDDKQNVRVLLTINDVTDARRAERTNTALLLEKDDLLRERAVLLQEMQHRVANSLQIIASVLLLKARTVKSEETRHHLKDAHDRVMSVAAVQQHLQASTGDVEVGPYLVKLCESLASSMIRESRPLTLQVQSDRAKISSQKAVSLGLIVTELVINALKHAFPDSRGGMVEVTYHASRRREWALTVTDTGIGRSPASSAAEGRPRQRASSKRLPASCMHMSPLPGRPPRSENRGDKRQHRSIVPASPQFRRAQPFRNFANARPRRWRDPLRQRVGGEEGAFRDFRSLPPGPVLVSLMRHHIERHMVRLELAEIRT